MDPAGLPRTTTEQARSYLISGSLGVLFFVVSGLLWDTHPFLGSLFLELGGGAFIVFLLEFLLPSALGYAVRVRSVALVWSDVAVEALLVDYDRHEVEPLLKAIEQSQFPPRESAGNGVSATGLRTNGYRLLERMLPVGPTVVRYYRRRRKLVGVTVVITDLRHHGDAD